MKLYRYVLADFRPRLRQEWERKSARVQDVTVVFGAKVAEEQPKDGRSVRDRRLVTAIRKLDRPPELGSDLRINIPAGDREACELALEHILNLVSVLESCARTILAPTLCVALEPESEEERGYLEASKGIAKIPKGEASFSWNIQWNEDIANALADRMAGVAVMSEAFSGDELGRYRDFVRFIELAFRLSFYDPRLSKKLTQFLAHGPYGYTRAEINQWVELRHPVTHADLQRTQLIALTSDVRPVLPRMQQACLDVLFNKADWGSASCLRRASYIPDAITKSPTGDLVVKQGSAPTMQFRIYDEFGIYPQDLVVSVDHSKDSLFARFADSTDGSPFAKKTGA